MNNFSLSTNTLKDILCYAKPLGHHEKVKNLNLGFGFIYYGIVRALRPGHILVIGSGYGFSVVCLALALKDNHQGELTFVDPSYSLLNDGPLKTIGGRGNWDDYLAVKAHFARFGVDHLITHYKQRSDEFFPCFAQYQLPPIDIAFIDGSHAYKDVKYDFLRVLEHSHKNTYIFLHDTNIYIRELLNHAGVKRWLKVIKRHKEYFEVVNFPFSSGVSLVHVLEPGIWRELQ
ncbi:MAG: class I SAM-dependent methyltransferase [Desulfobacca sp.]|nr:class I SAM-dependent methyltransferase [Desulfobacca sp.]